jgi:membrane associated rhomboid family serine protease
MQPLRPFRRRTPDEARPDASNGAPNGLPAGDLNGAKRPWPDLAPLVDGTPAGRLSHAQARLWSLVLRARRVPHRLRSMPGGYTVQVPARFARAAVDEILLYQKENVSPHPSIPLPEPEERSRPTVAAMLALCGFFVLTQRPWPLFDSYPQYWHRVGVGDAGLILSGELWRCVTALTLHADPAHIASNAVVGGAFLILLSRRVGSGAAWLLAILSGALGNLINALAQGPGHLSVGFSTAVFGVAGALAGLKAAHGHDAPAVAPLNQPRQATLRSDWLLPVAAALALVAMLGTAGENTDIGAHFFGLLAGGGLGAALGALSLQLGSHGERLDEWVDTWLSGRGNAVCAVLAVLMPAACWAWGWMSAWPR